jgi:hypothetical protein
MIMKKIFLLCVVFSLAMVSQAQVKFGFVAPGYDNYTNSDPDAAFELIVYVPGNDTLDFEVGASVSDISGSAVNGVHYNFTPILHKFMPGTNVYDGSSRKKYKLNLTPDANFWGTREFKIVLTSFIGVTLTDVIRQQTELRCIIDYDGSSIGLPKLTVEQYTLYPVPATDKLFIDGVESKEYKIYDLSGRVILEGTTIENTIDVSSLSTGVYVIKSITDQGLLTQKFTKQ